MIRRILKKDLKRKRTLNFIVLMFIILATTFMASSINNLITTLNALSYFADETNVADYFLVTDHTNEVEDWAEDKEYVDSVEKEEFIMLDTGDLKKGQKNYETTALLGLSRMPQNYNLVVDQDDQSIEKVNPGEAAISYVGAQENNIDIGDQIKVSVNGKVKTFEVALIVKDMVFGSAYMGFERIIISDKDYKYLREDADNIRDLYSFNSGDTEALAKGINRENFITVMTFDSDVLNSTYMMEMMVFSALIIVGICLIAIALIVLRFTIVFTLQEDYKEIGIMKAIGLKDADIKKLFLLKYLFMAILGATVGFLLSFPFGEVFMKSVRRQMVIGSSAGNMGNSALCAVTVVALVAIFCYTSTGKVKRFTVIQAIRNGSGGERFRKRGLLMLNRCKRLPAVFYLAINDILSNFRSYVVLVIVFLLGTLLVILPSNIGNTLESDEVIKLFGLQQTDIYIDNNCFLTYVGAEEKMELDLNELETRYRENNIEINLLAEKLYTGYIYLQDEEDKSVITCIQSYRSDENEYLYLTGTTPLLENEIAMSKVAMERYGVVLGDYIYIRIGEETRQYVITGCYQTMMNMGEQIRLAEAVPTDSGSLSMLYTFQGQFEDRTDIDGQIEKVKALTPAYKIRNAYEFTDSMLESIRDTMRTLKFIILIVVIGINALISVLMCKSLFTRDIGNIALLKSSGFRNSAIRIWQAARIIVVMLVSLAAAMLLSMPLNKVVGKLTFGAMGAANIEMEINVGEVFVLYPLILQVVTALAVVISTIGVNKVGLKELGNIE